MRKLIKHIDYLFIPKLVIVLLFLSINILSSAQIAIVVNSNNPVSELSINELKAIFLGKQVYFRQGENLILLCDYKPDIDEFCTKVYGYSGKTMNKHWFQLIFSGTSANPPKKMNSVENLLNFISIQQNAIGYISVKNIPQNVKGIKVLKIEGQLPGGKDYLLSDLGLPKSKAPKTLTLNMK